MSVPLQAMLISSTPIATLKQSPLSSNLPDSGAKVASFRLPAHFQPSANSVICGRGKDSFNHEGNLRFRITTSMFLDRYSLATSKQDKTLIVSQIVTIVRQRGGRFCKCERGAWSEVGDSAAREKVGALLRDCLHTQYRSSTKSKVAFRKQRREMQRQTNKVASIIEPDKNISSMSAPSACWVSNHDSQDHTRAVSSTRLDDLSSSSCWGGEGTPADKDEAEWDDCSTTSACWESRISLGHALQDDEVFDLDVF